jgi:lipid II:glycine glycyltransferase (peptidoglycan interpeptide bridge formation enzyme)
MRIEITIFLIAGFIMANIYTDGKYIKLLYSGKKYIQMAGVAFGAFMIYILLKKNPLRAREIINTSNDYIKYLPVDKNISNMISPILDFTARNQGNIYDEINQPIIPMGQSLYNNNSHNEKRILQSGKKSTKRSVSETKKKFVASRQNWKCGECENQLNAWFEVDHKIRLEYGGSNHVDNLVALCRECHGQKTTIENL